MSLTHVLTMAHSAAYSSYDDSDTDQIFARSEVFPRYPPGLIVIPGFAKTLNETFKNLSVATIQNTEPPLIDHIMHSQHPTAESLSTIPDTDQLGYLSDHRGAIVGFRLNEQTQRSKSYP